ncbi:MAG: N-acetyltransferase O1 (Establishment of cohesion protein 1) [Trichoglossum hirsutum]|nr:MAG: N-acetyltransferase O1 (Establishment of cohesion protein 1) [Trichoglossum hirsutum]
MKPANGDDRSTIKTYSRQSRRVFEGRNARPTLKRKKPTTEEESKAGSLREDAPASPACSSGAKLASEYGTCGNPLSSPARIPSPVFKAHRPTFSFLRRRQSPRNLPSELTIAIDDGILANITNNTDGQGPPAKKRKRLTQMQIDLGGDMQKTCKTCGMEYISSNVDDVTLHKKFHATNVGGVDLGKTFARGNEKVIWDSATTEDSEERGAAGLVVVVDRKSSVADKNRAQKVLEVARRELSAVAIRDEDLWGQVAYGNEKGDRFKVYLYVRGEKCVGLCLAERISGAKRIIARTTGGSKSSSVSVSNVSFAAVLGISRIWTSQSSRRQGIARRLLECAASSFIYGMSVPKAMMAFSQPTESGGELADRWFEGIKDWGVYSEQ